MDRAGLGEGRYEEYEGRRRMIRKDYKHKAELGKG